MDPMAPTVRVVRTTHPPRSTSALARALAACGCLVFGGLGALGGGAAPARAGVEPLVLRIQDTWGTPGGSTSMVIRTYASRPVRRGKVVVRAGSGARTDGSPGVLAGGSPIASWDGGYVFDASGAIVATLTPTPDGQGVEAEFESASATINRDDGVVAVVFVTFSGAVSPGDEYPIAGDTVASFLEDPDDDPILMTYEPGRLRVRAPSAPVEFEASETEVQPGSAAIVELGTGEPFAIGSGTLRLTYDPALLAAGELPTAALDPRHGSATVEVSHPAPGVVEIDLVSDGSLNSEVPGDLLRLFVPIDPDAPLDTDSPLDFDLAVTELRTPGGAPIDVLYENGRFELRLVPDVFYDDFEIGDAGWWSRVVEP
jgi:hypothetical protein